MNTDTLSYTNNPLDITKLYDLVLEIQIDSTGWTLHTQSALKCVPDNRVFRYSLGDDAQIRQVGHRIDDTDTLQDIHVFLIESFKQLSAIFSVLRKTCKYTLIFLEDHVHLKSTESLKNILWEGIITPGGECMPITENLKPHGLLFENFDTDTLESIFQAINEERFDAASPVEFDAEDSYRM